MESSIAVFLERQSACELLPTISGVGTLQNELMEPGRVKRIKMEEGVYQNSTPRQRFSGRQPPSQKLLFLTWVLMHVAADLSSSLVWAVISGPLS